MRIIRRVGSIALLAALANLGFPRTDADTPLVFEHLPEISMVPQGSVQIGAKLTKGTFRTIITNTWDSSFEQTTISKLSRTETQSQNHGWSNVSKTINSGSTPTFGQTIGDFGAMLGMIAAGVGATNSHFDSRLGLGSRTLEDATVDAGASSGPGVGDVLGSLGDFIDDITGNTTTSNSVTYESSDSAKYDLSLSSTLSRQAAARTAVAYSLKKISDTTYDLTNGYIRVPVTLHNPADYGVWVQKPEVRILLMDSEGGVIESQLLEDDRDEYIGPQADLPTTVRADGLDFTSLAQHYIAARAVALSLVAPKWKREGEGAFVPLEGFLFTERRQSIRVKIFSDNINIDGYVDLGKSSRTPTIRDILEAIPGPVAVTVATPSPASSGAIAGPCSSSLSPPTLAPRAAATPLPLAGSVTAVTQGGFTDSNSKNAQVAMVPSCFQDDWPGEINWRRWVAFVADPNHHPMLDATLDTPITPGSEVNLIRLRAKEALGDLYQPRIFHKRVSVGAPANPLTIKLPFNLQRGDSVVLSAPEVEHLGVHHLLYHRENLAIPPELPDCSHYTGVPLLLPGQIIPYTCPPPAAYPARDYCAPDGRTIFAELLLQHYPVLNEIMSPTINPAFYANVRDPGTYCNFYRPVFMSNVISYSLASVSKSTVTDIMPYVSVTGSMHTALASPLTPTKLAELYMIDDISVLFGPDAVTNRSNSIAACGPTASAAGATAEQCAGIEKRYDLNDQNANQIILQVPSCRVVARSFVEFDPAAPTSLADVTIDYPDLSFTNDCDASNAPNIFPLFPYERHAGTRPAGITIVDGEIVDLDGLVLAHVDPCDYGSDSRPGQCTFRVQNASVLYTGPIVGQLAPSVAVDGPSELFLDGDQTMVSVNVDVIARERTSTDQLPKKSARRNAYDF